MHLRKQNVKASAKSQIGKIKKNNLTAKQESLKV